MRDFSVVSNRGLTIRICGDFTYEAIGFDRNPLPKNEIDSYPPKTKPAKDGCRIIRFRGAYNVTFTLNKTAKYFQAVEDPWY